MDEVYNNNLHPLDKTMPVSTAGIFFGISNSKPMLIHYTCEHACQQVQLLHSKDGNDCRLRTQPALWQNGSGEYGRHHTKSFRPCDGCGPEHRDHSWFFPHNCASGHHQLKFFLHKNASA
jgi:hypothetical protein